MQEVLVLSADPPRRSTDPSAVYRGLLDALNRYDLDAAEQYIDLGRYREDCVGFTRGRVDWQDARASVSQVMKGIPDLSVEILDLIAGPDSVIARGLARGTNTGRLYGAPPSKRRYEVSYFDWVRLDNGLIVERVQQADILGQMKQMYGRAFGTVALGAMLVR